MAEYVPQEGIDYIVDFYAIAGVEPDAEPQVINKAITKITAGYHPDRMVGLAPDVVARGERMTRLLNHARGILTNPEKRSEYDNIRAEWEGPVSTTGDPIVVISRALQYSASTKSPEELEADLDSTEQKADIHARYSEDRIASLERMIESAGDNVSADLRQMYEEALLEQDRNLAIKEGLHGNIMGLPDISARRDIASLDYHNKVKGTIEVTKERHVEALRAIAMGETARKLELLTGTAPTPPTDIVDPSSITVPAYINAIAARVDAIAKERQKIVEKRLENFYPVFPEPELQKEAMGKFVIGFEDTALSTWVTFALDIERDEFDQLSTDGDIRTHLDTKEYAEVIKLGFNVIVVPQLEQLEPAELFNKAFERYVEKYYPDDSPEGN